jgi:hypothetical protein
LGHGKYLKFGILLLSLPWVKGYLPKAGKNREEEWIRSIAVGSQPFVENVKDLVGVRANGREVTEGTKGYQLREEGAGDKALFEVKNSDIALENTCLWDTNG